MTATKFPFLMKAFLIATFILICNQQFNNFGEICIDTEMLGLPVLDGSLTDAYFFYYF